MTTQEFAQKVRLKYPNGVASDGRKYSQITDDELTQKVIDKYPIYKSQIDQPKKPGLIQSVKDVFLKRSENINNIADKYSSDTSQMKQGDTNGILSLGSAALQTAGQAAGAFNDIGFEAAKRVTPSFIKEPAKKLLASVASTNPVQNTMSVYESWKQKHPDAAKNLEAVVDIASVLPETKIADVGLKGRAKGAGLTAKTGKQLLVKTGEKMVANKTNKIAEYLMPELTKAEKATAISQGKAVEGGILKVSKINPIARDIERAKSVEGIIDIKKSAIENVNKTRQEISQEAENAIGLVKESKNKLNLDNFSAKIDAIERPISIVSDTKLNTMYDLAKEKFLLFIKKEKPTAEGFLKARKNFDSWITEQIPKVWDEPSIKPLNKALRDMRTTANDFIAESLPKGSEFKASLRKQNLMYEAIDNLSEKAAKELGQSGIQKFIKKPLNQKLLKVGGGVVGAGVVGGAANTIINR